MHLYWETELTLYETNDTSTSNWEFQDIELTMETWNTFTEN